MFGDLYITLLCWNPMSHVVVFCVGVFPGLEPAEAVHSLPPPAATVGSPAASRGRPLSYRRQQHCRLPRRSIGGCDGVDVGRWPLVTSATPVTSAAAVGRSRHSTEAASTLLYLLAWRRRRATDRRAGAARPTTGRRALGQRGVPTQAAGPDAVATAATPGPASSAGGWQLQRTAIVQPVARGDWTAHSCVKFEPSDFVVKIGSLGLCLAIDIPVFRAVRTWELTTVVYILWYRIVDCLIIIYNDFYWFKLLIFPIQIISILYWLINQFNLNRVPIYIVLSACCPDMASLFPAYRTYCTSGNNNNKDPE